MSEEPQYYQAYLLRCWQESPAQPGDPPTGWRFALEKVAREPERRGFSSLEALFAYLREVLEINIVTSGG